MNHTETRILINETKIPDGLELVTNFRSFSEIKTGIFNTLERLNLEYPGSPIYYSGRNNFLTNVFHERYPHIQKYKNEEIDIEIKPEGFLPWQILPNIARQIEEDLEIYKKSFSNWKDKFKVKSDSFQFVGKKKHLYIHPEAVIYPGVVFDVTTGPIIIDKAVEISPFSFLEGPLYIAQNAKIDNARITGGSIIGDTCKIGGEVENSIFEAFSNKHHEGFVGHSYIGSWVNFGALATTSDLKNNYGFVKIQTKEKQINTETIKFGAIVADFSKIAIGVMLNTGSVIDIGCNITTPRVKGYTPSFTWADSQERYRLDHFIQDTKKIMARRNKTLSFEEEVLLKSLYEN